MGDAGKLGAVIEEEVKENPTENVGTMFTAQI